MASQVNGYSSLGIQQSHRRRRFGRRSVEQRHWKGLLEDVKKHEKGSNIQGNVVLEVRVFCQ